jgi:hypothetical protein
MVRFMRHDSWDNALFVHFPVDAAALQSKLPAALRVDTHEGVAYVGVVCLTEAGIVPFPPGVPLWLVRMLGLSHHAVNVRTYVRPAAGDGPPGIYFFTLDCSAMLPAVGARALFNLPYRYARMRRHGTELLGLQSTRFGGGARVAAEWVADEHEAPQEEEERDSTLGRFLVERYALYQAPGCALVRLLMRAGATLWCGTITHAPWPLRRARLTHWECGVLEAAGLASVVLGGKTPVVHASSGVGPIHFFWNGWV